MPWHQKRFAGHRRQTPRASIAAVPAQPIIGAPAAETLPCGHCRAGCRQRVQSCRRVARRRCRPLPIWRSAASTATIRRPQSEPAGQSLGQGGVRRIGLCACDRPPGFDCRLVRQRPPLHLASGSNGGQRTGYSLSVSGPSWRWWQQARTVRAQPQPAWLSERSHAGVDRPKTSACCACQTASRG